MITEGERLLSKRWETAGDLAREFPHMGSSLSGIFASDEHGDDKFKVYGDGRVVSRELVQTQRGKNPTVGIILPGRYNFNTDGNIEIITVLDGLLEASVNSGPVSRLRRDGAIIVPARTTFHLETMAPVFYLRRYTS
jgi:uncharacterized protein YaiE (UPF0345 family)